MARARTTAAGLSERRQAVLERIAQAGKMSIDQLAQEFSVSLMTMHRDLDVLVGRNQLFKSRGKVWMLPAVTMEVATELRKQNQLAAKKAIAGAALAELPERGAILMDDSTTLLPLAQRLDERGSYTVITNSLAVAQTVAGSQFSQVVLLGGSYQPAYDSTIGSEVSRALRRLHADVVFMSAAAVSLGRLYHPMQSYAALKEEMLGASHRHVLLVDSSKFGRHAAFGHGDVSACDAVITDANVPPMEERAVRELGARVIVVEVEQSQPPPAPESVTQPLQATS